MAAPNDLGEVINESEIIVDDNIIYGSDDDEFGEELNRFDTICAICDNGGRLICTKYPAPLALHPLYITYSCEGKCNRSFHPTVEDGVDSVCTSLGYTIAELKAMEIIEYYCKNCEYKQHQCFVCGELGSSDESAGAQVFRCVIEACGQFYHPRCISELLHNGNDAAAGELEMRIVTGEQFECPLHKCHVCKELEVKSDPDLQFAVCRRCPKAYHRKCLPSEIAFGERAWDRLLPNRIAIFCMEHDIVEDIGTPLRNHIKFPDPEQN